ncbi:MAG: TolC family protein [Bacteroidales bacterium]|jgi:outer membrane protein|nr:TolC family protein [Bacteroidales bacterium]
MKNRFLIVVILLMTLSVVDAQEKWTLTQCFEHAHAQNIQIKHQELNAEYQKNLLSQSKSDRLPNLNASVSQNFGFGRSRDRYDVLVSSNGSVTSFGINSSVMLYQGGALKKNIEIQKSELKSSLEDLKKAKDDITINITQFFLEVLFAEELIKVAEEQLEQTKIQITRSELLVQAGKIAEGTLLEIKAQEARESLELVKATNTHRMALLNLVQLLELDDYSGFGIQQPLLLEMQAQLSLLSAKQVFEASLAIRPEIKSAEYQLESSQTRLEVAQSAYIPSLSASAGFSDQYNTDYSGNVLSFGTQLNDNTQSYIGLNLSIPIFNRHTVRNNVKNSEIQIENMKLDLEGTKKELRRQIEQAYINALASFERYNANDVAVESMEESFRYMEQKFNLGRVNSVEYNDSKTKLTKAQSDLVQARYEFIFRTKILDFYYGIPIVL